MPQKTYCFRIWGIPNIKVIQLMQLFTDRWLNIYIWLIFLVCDLSSFLGCHKNDGTKTMCSNPNLYTICKQPQGRINAISIKTVWRTIACIDLEYPSLLSEYEHNDNIQMDQFTASSYQMANPPWLASPRQCSSFCFDVQDHERYIFHDYYKWMY